jgi:hypothetical protein
MPIPTTRISLVYLNTLKRVLGTILRIVRNLLIFLSLLVIFGLWALRSDSMQERLLPYVENLLENQLGVPVEVGHIDLDLPAHVVVRNAVMRDQQGQKMFAAHELQVSLLSFSLWDLILHPSKPKKLRVSHIQVIQPEAHLYRSRRDSSMNLDFLTASDDTTSGEPIELDLEVPELRIRGGIFSYVDSTKTDAELAEAGRVNFSNMHLRRINGDFSFHLFPDQNIEADIRGLTATEERSMLFLNEFTTEAAMFRDSTDPGWMLLCLENSLLHTGRTRLDFTAQLENDLGDSLDTRVFPSFSADFHPSVFDFTTLNFLMPKALPMRDPVRLEGFLWGDMEFIKSDSLVVGLYDETELHMRTHLTCYTREEDLHYHLDISQGQVKFEELQRFLPDVDIPLRGLARLKGEVIADLERMRTRNLRVDYGKQTDMLVKARLYDYTDGDKIFMDIRFRDSHLAFNEIRQLLPSMQLPPFLDAVGRTNIDGKFIGGVTEFLLDAQMVSKYGELDANVQLKLPPLVEDLGYNGWLTTRNVDLSGLENELGFRARNINFDGRIEGHGTEFGLLEADIDGKLIKSEFEGFVLDEVRTDTIRIRGPEIRGGIRLTDAQGDAGFTVFATIPDSGRKKIDLYGGVNSIDLAYYQLLPEDSVRFSSAMNIHLKGDSVEDFTGRISLMQMNMIRTGSPDSLHLDDFVIKSRLSEQHEHTVTLNSSLLEMQLRGQFTYKKALNLTQRLSKEIRMYIQNNDTVIARYYAEKMLEPENVQLWDTLWTKRELNDLLTFFKVPLYVQPETQVIWHLDHGMTDVFDLSMRSDSIAYDNISLIGDTVTLNIFKDGSQNKLLLLGDLMLDTVAIGENLNFENVHLQPEGDDSLLYVLLRTDQADIGNRYVLKTKTRFKRGGLIVTTVEPEESFMSIKGKRWAFDGGNSVTRRFGRPLSWKPGEYPDSTIARYLVKDLILSNEGQKIAVRGAVSKDFLDMLRVDLTNVRIASLLEILEQPLNLDGTVDHARLTAFNLLDKQPTTSWDVRIDDFRYQPDDSIGVRFKGGWPQDSRGEIAGLDLEFGHWGEDSVVISGIYNVKMDTLDLKALPSTVLLSWAEPLVEGILSDMQGKVSVDNFEVSGSLSQPKMNGIAHLSDAGFKADYLNNVFRLSDNDILFDNKGVTIPGISVRDTFGGSAMLTGTLRNVEGDFISDLKMFPINKLTVLDTRKGENPDFYGHVVLDGDSARVTGPVTKPFLEAWVTTGDSCWLDIPLSDYTSASRLDFVNFIREEGDQGDSVKMDLGGFRLRLTVNANENAKVRMIFDEKTGDIIEARGQGAITLDITEEGEFLMSGPYTISKGQYLFTAENIINKKFLVAPGGTIIWSGDPYDAQVNLKAIYEVNADITALSPGATSRVPIDIVMKMTGSLMQPEIALDLVPNDGASAGTELDSYFRRIQYDQQELNKQVVSLMLFGRFTGHSGGSGGVAGAGVTSSISELISNQVNYWIAQAFDNANVGVEVNTNEFQDVELALRASLFNNKVTVERDGAIVSNNGNGFSIGDLSVQVKVLPATDSGRADPQAGQLVVEIFNREDVTLNTANNISRGTGLFYKKNFDRFSELFRSREKRKRADDGKKDIGVDE